MNEMESSLVNVQCWNKGHKWTSYKLFPCLLTLKSEEEMTRILKHLGTYKTVTSVKTGSKLEVNNLSQD